MRRLSFGFTASTATALLSLSLALPAQCGNPTTVFNNATVRLDRAGAEQNALKIPVFSHGACTSIPWAQLCLDPALRHPELNAGGRIRARRGKGSEELAKNGCP